MENKISIITPVYNGKKFIKECLETFIAQKCCNAEHIIVDGKSLDKTLDIVKSYAEKYSHIRWISEKDSGQSDAMNKGIKMAEGNIISFLNVDDFYQPNVLNRALQIFKDLKEPSFVYGNTIIWEEDDWGNYYASRLWVPKFLTFEELLKNHKLDPQPPNPSGYFYHKSLHDMLGPYNNKLHYIMDKDFILRTFAGANIIYVNETWGNYRYIKNTKTHNNLSSPARIWGKYEEIFNNNIKQLYGNRKAMSKKMFMPWIKD